MCGDEINAGKWLPARCLVQVGAARETVGKFAERLIDAANIITNSVSIFPVPLRPVWWEVSDLVSALADVPRFGDELCLPHYRVLLDQIEKRREAIDFV